MKSRRFIRILLPIVLSFCLRPIGYPLRGFFYDRIPLLALLVEKLRIDILSDGDIVEKTFEMNFHCGSCA